jgi:hypothetical protein
VVDAEGVPEVLLRLQDPVTPNERAVFDEVCATSDVPARAIEGEDGQTWVAVSLRPASTAYEVHQQLDAIQAMLDKAKDISLAELEEPSPTVSVNPHSGGSVPDLELAVAAWWLTWQQNNQPAPGEPPN